MAKPNYGFAKRQRDLVKKQKKEEKVRKKAAAKLEADGGAPADTAAEGAAPALPETPAPGGTPAGT